MRKNFVMRHALSIGIAAFVLAAMLFPAVSSAATSSQLGVPLQPGIWVLVAGIVVLGLIAIAAIVYALSGVLDSPTARGWARAQMYEGILTLIILSAFLAFNYLFLLDPTNALSSINLMPGAQPNAQPGYFDCTSPYGTTMYNIATCDIATFNAFAYQIFQMLVVASIYLAYTPGLSLGITLGAQATNTHVSVSASTDSLIPFSAETNLGFAYAGILLLFLINQIQVLLLAGSLFWLGFFVSLGVIARAFGFLRTFGGAMIAMGLGLGFVYPLVTTITYGFINVQLGNSPTNNVPDMATNMFGTVIAIALGIPAPANTWIFPMAIAIAGLTFIPFLNFTIVDAFIVDFSKAIGERLDFMSLMVGII